MLKAFTRAGKFNPLNEDHQLWQNGNCLVVLFTPAVIEQKIDYIHENPVRAVLSAPRMSIGIAVLMLKVR